MPGASKTRSSIHEQGERVLFRASTVEVPAAGPLLSPFLLFGSGSYFGEFEMFIQKPRVCSVRCELTGTLLALSKAEFIRLADEFPDFADIWKARSLRREGHRKASLRKLTEGRSLKHLAAIMVQRFLRKRCPPPGATVRASLCGLRPSVTDPFMLSKVALRPSVTVSSSTCTGDEPAKWEGLPDVRDAETLRAHLREVTRLRADMDALRSEIHNGHDGVKRKLSAIVHALSRPLAGNCTEWV